MGDVKWIKITTDIFDDEKILLIESLPEADSIITIWFKLLCMAGKMNNSGVFMMNDKMAYTDEMLAVIFRRKKATVALALKTFEEFGMIKVIDSVITIPNWGKHQSLERLENRRKYQREYQRDYRKKQKELIEMDDSKCLRKCLREDLCQHNVNSLEEEGEGEEEGEEEREEELIESLNDSMSDKSDNAVMTFEADSVKDDVKTAIQAWNNTTFSKVQRVSSSSDRYKRLSARIKEYGVEDVLRAISIANQSSFLKGATWFNFDWFVRPNNFPKVLEGNYSDKKGNVNDTRNTETAEERAHREWVEERHRVKAELGISV